MDMNDQFTNGFDTGFGFQTGLGPIQANVADSVPVDLARFEGIASGDAVVLSWTTASETGNAEFAIQRAAGGRGPILRIRDGSPSGVLPPPANGCRREPAV